MSLNQFLTGVFENVVADLLILFVAFAVGYLYIFGIANLTPYAKLRFIGFRIIELLWRGVFGSRRHHQLRRTRLPIGLVKQWEHGTLLQGLNVSLVATHFGVPCSGGVSIPRSALATAMHNVIDTFDETRLPYSKMECAKAIDFIVNPRNQLLHTTTSIFNGEVYRLNRFEPMSQTIELQSTSFFHFMLTNFLFNQDQAPLPLRTRESLHTPLSSSMRANNIAIHLNIILKGSDDIYYLVLTRRTRSNLNFPSSWGHTAGGDIGGVDMKVLTKALSSTAARELREEANLNVDPEKIIANALIVNECQLQPILICSYVGSADSLKGITFNSELKNYFNMKFSPQSVASLMQYASMFKSHFAKRFHGDILADLYFSLSTCYGYEEINRVFGELPDSHQLDL